MLQGKEMILERQDLHNNLNTVLLGEGLTGMGDNLDVYL